MLWRPHLVLAGMKILRVPSSSGGARTTSCRNPGSASRHILESRALRLVQSASPERLKAQRVEELRTAKQGRPEFGHL